MRTSEHDRRTLIRFMVGAVLITISLSGILMLGASTMVMTQSVDDYVGPAICQACHVDNYDEWDGIAHSNAFTDEAVQLSPIHQFNGGLEGTIRAQGNCTHHYV